MEIRILFPDDEKPDMAVSRLNTVFNGHKVDWKSAETGITNGLGFTFGDDKKGVLYRTKQGFTLKVYEEA